MTLAAWLCAPVAAATPAAGSPRGPVDVELGELGPQLDAEGSVRASAGSPERTTRAYLARLAPRLGLNNPQRELRVSDLDRPAGPGFVVRLQQEYRGIPIVAAELVARLNGRQRMLSLAGELLPVRGLGTAPRLGAHRAALIARDRVAASNGLPADTVRASQPELEIYDPRMIGAPGPVGPRLVWRAEVDSGSPGPGGEAVLVDARDGRVLLTIPLVAEAAPDRRICDAAFKFLKRCVPPYARAEGDPPSGIAELDQLYENLGLAWEFYLQHFGRDGYSDGEPIVATARYCDGFGCPYENAAYDFSDGQIRVGEGWGVADVIGHEYTHAITDHSSRLYYLYESGSINESLSDIFGELIEPAGHPTWLWGQDLPGGPIRNLRNPPAFDNPDRMRSPLWDPGGEVHDNSGVGNKAGYLIVEGGEFRGRQIDGLGPDKGAAVYYEAQVAALTSGSNYRALGFALPQACRNLQGGPVGITAADCASVREAIAATQMRRRPLTARPGNAARCPARETRPVDAFYDDLEDPSLLRWRARSTSRQNGWRYPQPAGETRATSGVTNFWAGTASGPRGKEFRASIAMRKPVQIPPGGRLHFNHWYSFGSGGDSKFADGGILQYRAADRRGWRDARRLFDAHGYNGRLESRRQNPLTRHSARRAFVGESQGYGASRLNLGRLAGKRVRFRFTYGIGRRQLIPTSGWWIDDIQIYRCVPK